VCRIGPLLQKKGHQVAVIAPSDSVRFSFKKIDGLDVYGVPSCSVVINPTIRIPIPVMLKSRVKRIMEDFQPDIIHIQDHFPLSKAVVAVNKKLKIPIMGTNHFMPENFTVLLRGEYSKKWAEGFLWKGFSKVFNQVSLVTTPTETGARLIRPRLKPEVVAVSSGISLETFKPSGDNRLVMEKYLIPHKPILLYVGRLDPEKHMEEILHAVKMAVKKIDFSFVIVGKGTSKTSLEKLALELGISNNVLFTGYVPDADLPSFYQFSRCFIIASIAELLSLGTLQAMACGLPVVAVNAGALSELVKDKVNGYLFAEGDVEAIANHIVDILSNDERYRKMSEKSLEQAQRHDIHRTLESFEELYRLQISRS
jgi:glycosyltransferase involved in cell wall biosynthesis